MCDALFVFIFNLLGLNSWSHDNRNDFGKLTEKALRVIGRRSGGGN